MLAVDDEVECADLPIGPRPPAVWRSQNLHAPGRAPEQRIEIPSKITEIVLEIDCFNVPATEDQPLVNFNSRCWHEIKLGKIGANWKMFVEGSGKETTGLIVGPAVIGADKISCISSIGSTQSSAAVSTAVE